MSGELERGVTLFNRRAYFESHEVWEDLWQESEERAKALLSRLNVPSRLWGLAPSTFSGGEQQRVNIARGFIADYPVLLLDEPTASLDSTNSAAVVSLIEQARDRGAAIVGIFHANAVRDRIANRLHVMNPVAESAL